MFTSVPLFIIFLCFIFLLQTVFFYFYELNEKGFYPLLVSLAGLIGFFPVSFFLKRKSHFNHYALVSFLLLFFFYFIQLFLMVFFQIRYLWSLLLLVQILSSYYMLSNRYFYFFTFFNGFVYSWYFLIYFTKGSSLDSLLAMVFALFLSLLIHCDRRNALTTLADSYEKQKEINNRFRQLEENISQVFLLTSTDMQQIFYVSSAFEDLVKISREEFIKNPSIWREFIFQGDKLRVDLEIETVIQERNAREFDCRIDSHEGLIWLRFQIYPVKSELSVGIDRFAIIVDDITESKMAELKLAEARSLDGEMAARIQRNLLFSDFDIPIEGVDGAAESIPSLDVGGDFYDIYNFSPHMVDLIIADVMGKGRIAAMLGAASKSAFMKARLDLSVKYQEVPPIDRIVSETSRSISGELMQMGKFITLQYARLDMEKEIFEFVDKGHTSILHYSARLKCFWSLKGWNMPIGFNPEEKEILSVVPVEQGDLFFLYSDGIIEAENAEGEQFGERRLIYLLKNSIHLTSSQIINKIKNIIFHYSCADSYSDDITCIALKTVQVKQHVSLKNIILEGRRESLKTLRSFTADFLRSEFPGIEKDTHDAVIIALNEAVANVIEHNYEKDPELEGREIYLTAERKGNSSFFRLFWDGREFDWSVLKAPDLSELKSGGYGVSLMKEIMDSISYSANIDGVQQLIMVKDILSAK
ncbi:ATP-binding SpoIIE family protein phosphatase [Spirochaeta isovalerica]|uniref:PAS domain S-box-containing protein n=1 Tax=Spirochaeta isovalerica TaxID=150 RepID=A0A841RBW3_9SPIO|nr:SpoIIE family protein phosphatase [Spirochaeta isovalerica]MBB6481465.1 PAS domain S-box-containing protein [Spirochaeta isovalerica]